MRPTRVVIGRERLFQKTKWQTWEGELQQVMQAGCFRFRVRAPEGARVRALDFSGAPGADIPVSWRDGWLEFDLDTSRLDWGTPFFEIARTLADARKM